MFRKGLWNGVNSRLEILNDLYIDMRQFAYNMDNFQVFLKSNITDAVMVFFSELS